MPRGMPLRHWGGQMRFGATLVVCAGLSLTVAGCDTTDKVFFREGIGTELNSGEIAASTTAQNDYVKYVCQQAGLAYDEVANTCENSNKTATWQLFVQAGMNDIDQRCDAYLQWLDYVRRAKDPTLKVLADAATYSAFIMDRSGVSAAPIAITGAALGFARNTFSNVTSRLILEVNHSAVQSVVLTAQKDFREDLFGSKDKNISPVVIASKPAAIYALRSYLRLCMPVTIEAEINNTVVTFARSGGAALDRQEPLVSGRNVSVTATTADQKQAAPIRNPVEPPPPEFAKFFEEKNLSKQEVNLALRALCFDKNKPNKNTKAEIISALVGIYENYRDQDKPPSPNGQISRREREIIEAQTKCGEARNYYERMTFANTTNAGAIAVSADGIKSFAEDLLSRSKAGKPVKPNPTLDALREQIKAARAELKMTDVPADMNNQITSALITALQKLPVPTIQPAPANAPAPPGQPPKPNQ